MTLIKLNNLEEFINSVIVNFKEYDFNFKEIDNLLFFIDLDSGKEHIVIEINKQNDYSRELVRDLVLLERNSNNKDLEHYEFIKRK